MRDCDLTEKDWEVILKAWESMNPPPLDSLDSQETVDCMVEAKCAEKSKVYVMERIPRRTPIQDFDICINILLPHNLH